MSETILYFAYVWCVSLKFMIPHSPLPEIHNFAFEINDPPLKFFLATSLVCLLYDVVTEVLK